MSISQNFPEIKPSLNLDFANTKSLDGRVTFSRASSATYYGTETAKAEENLLLHSQEFETTWGPSNTTVTANTADTNAPDGTTTAEKLTNNTTNISHLLVQAATLNGSSYTFSVFAKKGTANFLILRGSDGTTARNVWFNLDTGAVATTQTNITASIVDEGNGWYRCIGTWSASTTASSNYVIGLSEADNTLTYAGTEKDIYIWGAQLEQRSAVTAYTPTTTQPITNYIPVLETASAGVARFDHNPLTFESLGLLVEEQRTNLVLRSEEFDNASWTKSNATITANTLVAPDGTLTGDKLIETADNTAHSVNVGTITTSTTAPSTFSFYAKAGERSVIQVRLGVQSLANRGQGNVDLSNGTVATVQNVGTATGTTLTATPVGNGWYRVAITTNPNDAASTQMRVFVILGNVAVSSMTGSAYTGDGYSGIYIWGAQLEAGAFPTSYIKTVASQVTRSADSASITGSNFSGFYNQAEGVLYGEWKSGAPNSFTLAEISDNVNNRVVTFVDGSNNLKNRVAYNGVNVFNPNDTYVVGAFNKTAIGYKVNNFAGTKNGATPTTGSSGNVPNVDRLTIGAFSAGSLSLNGHIRKLSYYPQRLSNTQLQALTS